MDNISYRSDSLHEHTVRDYLKVLFRHKIIILLPFVLLIPFTVIRQELRTPVYQAAVKMMVKAISESETDYYRSLPSPGRFISLSHAELVKSRAVSERVVKALKLYERPLDFDQRKLASKLKKYLIDRGTKEIENMLSTQTPQEQYQFRYDRAIEQLNDSIDVNIKPDTEFFYIIVRDYNPLYAKAIANSLSRSYLIYDLEQQVTEQKLKYGDRYSTVLQLQSHIQTLHDTLGGKSLPYMEAFGPASIKIVEQAETAVMTGGVNKWNGMILSVLISLSLGIAFAFIVDFLNPTFRTAREIESFLNVPFLGSIPSRDAKRLVFRELSNPQRTADLQSYHHLSKQIMLLKEKNIRSLLIADASDSKESAVVVANLGSYLVKKAGYRVLIIDADLYNSVLSETIGINGGFGLVDVLNDSSRLEDAIHEVSENLFFLTSGTPATESLIMINNSVMCNIISKAAEHYDVVFVISSDIKRTSDFVYLSDMTNGTVLFINEGKVKRAVLKHALAPLYDNKVKIVGGILNNCKYVIPKVLYKIT